jgi:integrase/recombinase XerD
MSVGREFLTYLSKHRIAVEEVKPRHITDYLQHALRLYRQRHGYDPKSLHARKGQQWWRYSHTTTIYMLLRLVHGHWPPPSFPETAAGTFQRDVCRQYDQWMADIRGLSRVTRSDRLDEAYRFLGWMGERANPQDLPGTTARDIDAYMVLRAKSLRRTTLKSRAAELRSFLRYLHATGRLLLNPSTAVLIPRVYTFENIPSAMRADDIKGVVEVTRKDHSPKGLRDFAILTLLTCYGLRAGEITALRLEDVRWQNGIIQIRHSKTGAHSELPLLPAAGNAIVNYLRKGRPQTLAREIFIRTRAPYQAFRSGSSLHRLISLRLCAGRIEPQGRHGPHAFRHAQAVGMLKAGVPIKEIGDVLGHCCAHSTNAYLKLATEDLRAVALEIPVEVNA